MKKLSTLKCVENVENSLSKKPELSRVVRFWTAKPTPYQHFQCWMCWKVVTPPKTPLFRFLWISPKKEQFYHLFQNLILCSVFSFYAVRFFYECYRKCLFFYVEIALVCSLWVIFPVKSAFPWLLTRFCSPFGYIYTLLWRRCLSARPGGRCSFAFLIRHPGTFYTNPRCFLTKNTLKLALFGLFCIKYRLKILFARDRIVFSSRLSFHLRSCTFGRIMTTLVSFFRRNISCMCMICGRRHPP